MFVSSFRGRLVGVSQSDYIMLLISWIPSATVVLRIIRWLYCVGDMHVHK